MIGRKTLAEIRRDISQRLKAEGIDEATFLKDLRRLQKKPRKDPAAIQSLLELADSLKGSKGRKRRTTSKAGS